MSTKDNGDVDSVTTYNMVTLPSTTHMQTQLRCVPLKWEGKWG
jgi:hypothetical protein